MYLQWRKMGSLAWIAGGAAAICLSVTSAFGQSGAYDPQDPSPRYTNDHPASRSDGWVSRGSNSADSGDNSANNGNGSTNNPRQSVRTYQPQPDRPTDSPRAGSPGYAPQYAAPNQQKTNQQQQGQQQGQQQAPYRRPDNVRSSYNNTSNDPTARGTTSAARPSDYQSRQYSSSNNESQPRPSSRTSNTYYLDPPSDQDANAYYGYRNSRTRVAMYDQGGVPHSARPVETMPGGEMEMVPGQPHPMGEMMPGPGWDGPPGDNGGGCGCGGNGGGSCGCGSGSCGCGGGCDSCGGGSCGGCCNPCCCGPVCRLMNCLEQGDWFHDLGFFVGNEAFRGPLDFSDSATKGNFGFHEGFNWGLPVAEGIGAQVGANFVHSDLTLDDFAHRNQIFLTTGLFYRPMGQCGFQGGLVFDYLHDEWKEVYSDINLDQLRGNLSYVFDCNEVGVWFAAGIRDANPVFTFGNVGTQVKAADIYALYYSRHFCGGGEARIWGGYVNDLGGLLGVDMTMPLSNAFSLQGGVEYLIPRSSSNNETDTTRTGSESWNIGFNLVWHPCHCCHNGCCDGYNPLFNVADNSTFLVHSIRPGTNTDDWSRGRNIESTRDQAPPAPWSFAF